MLLVSSTKIRSSESDPAFIKTTSLSTTLDHRNPSLTCALPSLPAANQCARRKAKWRRAGTRLLQVLIAYKNKDPNRKTMEKRNESFCHLAQSSCRRNG